MATYLKPDKVRTEKIGKVTITIKEKIIPNTAKAPKNVAPQSSTHGRHGLTVI